MGGLASLFGGGGKGSFSGGGIGSSQSLQESTTDNKNNAITGDDASIYDTRGGNITFADQGAIEKAFNFARESLGVAGSAIGTAQGIEESERTGGANRTLYIAIAAIAALVLLRR